MIELETPYLLGIWYTFSISLESGGGLILMYACRSLTYDVDWHSLHGYDAIHIYTCEKKDGGREKKERDRVKGRQRGKEKESHNNIWGYGIYNSHRNHFSLDFHKYLGNINNW